MPEIKIQDPREDLAVAVQTMWEMCKTGQRDFLARTADVRKYVTATTTEDTAVGDLPWKNRTTIPKLTQIADNLQAYYMAALMPSDEWFRFEGFDEEATSKANIIEAYMSTKLRQSHWRSVVEQLVRDWIIYGNCFAGITFVNETKKSLKDGSDVTIYRGPKLFRISPLDCVMDYRATSFDNSPFMYRKFVPLTKFMQDPLYTDEVKSKIKDGRNGYAGTDWIEYFKTEAFCIDGFQDINQFLNTNCVEVLEYWGDIYVEKTGQVLANRVITIVDRTWVARNEENPSWSGTKPFFHSGWRTLPDNLYGQGPLENLVGMQYRCDHLENLKADAFDQIIHPVIKVKGDDVEDFEFRPGAKIYMGAESDVEFLRPDSSVLLCDTQVAMYHGYMELLVGNPKEASGFRTPGEKTSFEVQVLQQGADRVFLHKLNHFEEQFVERALACFFEMLIRNFDIRDVARVFNDNPEAMVLVDITRDDVVADGIFKPMGSRYYAARNKRVQELQNFLAISQNPILAPHISGVQSAKMLNEELGFEKWKLVKPFVALEEQMMQKEMMQQMQTGMQEEDMEGMPSAP